MLLEVNVIVGNIFIFTLIGGLKINSQVIPILNAFTVILVTDGDKPKVVKLSVFPSPKAAGPTGFPA